MSIFSYFDRWYAAWRPNHWMGRFAIFCRVALAAGFVPAGLVKLGGERFTALPSNHPLGHYFDALFLTGYYYTFIGVGQLVAALLLLIPRTAVLGAMVHFPIMLNICVLSYATRFNGIRIVTLMLLANVFLLVWDYGRLRHVWGPRPRSERGPFPVFFFGCVLAAMVTVVIGGGRVFEVMPGNEPEECANSCRGREAACQAFCDCIYVKGSPLGACLGEYRRGVAVR